MEVEVQVQVEVEVEVEVEVQVEGVVSVVLKFFLSVLKSQNLVHSTSYPATADLPNFHTSRKTGGGGKD